MGKEPFGWRDRWIWSRFFSGEARFSGELEEVRRRRCWPELMDPDRAVRIRLDLDEGGAVR